MNKKIIPCMDIKNGKVVKGVNFENIKELANPVEMARFYNETGADELVFYDISASMENRKIFDELLENIIKEINIPLCIGGNIATIEDIDSAMKIGASKVSINTGAIKNPNIITQGAQKYGSECIVGSVDVKMVDKKYKIFISGGQKETELDAIEWIKELEKRGAGEIVVNSIDTDGVCDGFDLELLKQASQAVTIPIIASGGAGTMEDFLELFSKTKVNIGLAATVFHTKQIIINDLKKYLKDKNVK